MMNFPSSGWQSGKNVTESRGLHLSKKQSDRRFDPPENGLLMNGKNLRLLSLVILVAVAAWMIADFVRLGHLTASLIRTGLLIVAVILMLVARRRG